MDEFGLPEVGIDGGGVFKELMTRLTKEMLNPNYGLFETTEDGQIYPSTNMLNLEGTEMVSILDAALCLICPIHRELPCILELFWQGNWPGAAGTCSA